MVRAVPCLQRPRTVLVFEDDFAPAALDLQMTLERLQQSLHFLPSSWKALFLGRCWSDCTRDLRLGGDLYAVESALCMHAYALTRDAARAAVDAMESCRMDDGGACPCDVALSQQLRGTAQWLQTGGAGNLTNIGILAPAFAISPNLVTQFRAIGFSSTSAGGAATTPKVGCFALHREALFSTRSGNEICR